MLSRQDVDRALLQWGERLFFPPNRIVKPDPPPHLRGSVAERAAVIRQRLQGTAARRAPQVVLTFHGKGHGMKSIAPQLGYISRNGSLDVEDERGLQHRGKEAMRDLLDQWRFSGVRIEELSHRREAYYLVVSAPSGTDPPSLLKAVRDFSDDELKDHLRVMALHCDTDHPHVHLMVRSISVSGERLYKRGWTERERWRGRIAENLRELGVDVEATRQSARGEHRTADAIWQVKARGRGALLRPNGPTVEGERNLLSRARQMECWSRLLEALAASELPTDRQLAEHVAGFVRDSAFFQEVAGRDTARQAAPPERSRAKDIERMPQPGRAGPDLDR